VQEPLPLAERLGPALIKRVQDNYHTIGDGVQELTSENAG
jgi:hypothetical protein